MLVNLPKVAPQSESKTVADSEIFPGNESIPEVKVEEGLSGRKKNTAFSKEEDVFLRSGIKRVVVNRRYCRSFGTV